MQGQLKTNIKCVKEHQADDTQTSQGEAPNTSNTQSDSDRPPSLRTEQSRKGSLSLLASSWENLVLVRS